MANFLCTSVLAARAAKGATPKEVTGKCVVVWEKVGKTWKLTADIWNDGK
jgi:ketosteroid isomerase-like protein